VLSYRRATQGALEVKKVALDARLTRQMSVGMKAYAQELTARLPRVAPDLQFVAFRDGANFGFEEQVRLPMQIRREGVNLTHYLSLYTPALPPRPYVVTIHDLIHLRFPQYFKSKVGPYYRTVVRFACARAARVITDDDRTVADLRRFLGVDPAKVRVIALGANDRFYKPVVPYSAQREYVLYVGNHRPHKDLPTLFEAWAGLPSDLAVDLYVTGADDFGDLTRYSRTSGRIIALGDPSIDDLASYYAGARALVHPALCEGFGLPMLEAMAVGCPVVACEDAVPAVLQDATLTFAARDAAGARAAILSLLRDTGLRETQVARGRERAGTLTWDRCALETAKVYREILEERSQR
jgi:glycosyltransferase involved in cell wall biosynthesis